VGFGSAFRHCPAACPLVRPRAVRPAGAAERIDRGISREGKQTDTNNTCIQELSTCVWKN
ncbi:unnamed protein product, partial [Ectocarpus sp. 6 AP-2014]